jgi:hypothetical protein
MLVIDRCPASPRSRGCRAPCWQAHSRRRAAACGDGLELHTGASRGTLNHPGEAGRGERRAALADEHKGDDGLSLPSPSTSWFGGRRAGSSARRAIEVRL